MAKHIQEVKEFEEEVLSIDRVTRVVAGGRRLRFRAVVILGDKKGKIGLGTGKANDVSSAMQKAKKNAKKNMVFVPIFNDTIPHDIKIKYKSSHILFLPAGPGTGIIAGSVMRKILAIAGYKNILSKSFGSSNKLLNAQATFKALLSLKNRPERKNKTIPSSDLEKKAESLESEKKNPQVQNPKAETISNDKNLHTPHVKKKT